MTRRKLFATITLLALAVFIFASAAPAAAAPMDQTGGPSKKTTQWKAPAVPKAKAPAPKAPVPTLKQKAAQALQAAGEKASPFQRACMTAKGDLGACYGKLKDLAAVEGKPLSANGSAFCTVTPCTTILGTR